MGLPLLLAAIALGGCSEVFDDPTPENIHFEMRGEAGDRVRAIYSTQFVAGLNEFGVTRVQVVRSDTIVHEIPFRESDGHFHRPAVVRPGGVAGLGILFPSRSS